MWRNFRRVLRIVWNQIPPPRPEIRSISCKLFCEKLKSLATQAKSCTKNCLNQRVFFSFYGLSHGGRRRVGVVSQSLNPPHGAASSNWTEPNRYFQLAAKHLWAKKVLFNFFSSAFFFIPCLHLELKDLGVENGRWIPAGQTRPGANKKRHLSAENFGQRRTKFLMPLKDEKTALQDVKTLPPPKR